MHVLTSKTISLVSVRVTAPPRMKTLAVKSPQMVEAAYEVMLRGCSGSQYCYSSGRGCSPPQLL